MSTDQDAHSPLDAVADVTVLSLARRLREGDQVRWETHDSSVESPERVTWVKHEPRYTYFDLAGQRHGRHAVGVTGAGSSRLWSVTSDMERTNPGPIDHFQVGWATQFSNELLLSLAQRLRPGDNLRWKGEKSDSVRQYPKTVQQVEQTRNTVSVEGVGAEGEKDVGFSVKANGTTQVTYGGRNVGSIVQLQLIWPNDYHGLIDNM